MNSSMIIQSQLLATKFFVPVTSALSPIETVFQNVKVSIDINRETEACFPVEKGEAMGESCAHRSLGTGLKRDPSSFLHEFKPQATNTHDTFITTVSTIYQMPVPVTKTTAP